MTRDTASAKAFYTDLFGWSTKESDFMAYTEWMNGGQPIGGMLPMEGAQFEGVPPLWMIYFMVEDCDATTERAQSLGGNIHVPPTDIPNTGRFSVIQDPQGATFAVIKMTM
jgi:predicted enzyme related to lactoylglutathione lyase